MGEPIALPVANGAELVVAGQRPLEHPEHRSIERSVDDRAESGSIAGDLDVALVEAGHRGHRREDSGEIVRNGHSRSDRRSVALAGQVEQPAVGDAQSIETGSS